MFRSIAAMANDSGPAQSRDVAALAASALPYQGVIPMVPGTPLAQGPGRAVRVACTAPGNVALTYADGSSDTVPVPTGLTYLPGAISEVALPAQGAAAATFASMR